MSENTTSSTGETARNFLEKITPKDLVMFSPATRKVIAKNDFSFLGVDYDVQLANQEEQRNIKVWGLPYFNITDPVPMGIFGGTFVGALSSIYRSRPPLSSIHVHLISGIGIALSVALFQTQYEKYRMDRELVTWDYVKKHPQDFPEVFNPSKKYKDMVLPWRMSR